jgi:Zinc dependent phospholipase C/Bacterial Ig-like domain
MMMKISRPLLLILFVILFTPAEGFSHGANGHVKVTDMAVDLLPDGELRDILTDPEARNALQIGSFFPDAGYASNAPFGEAAHWPPFVEGYVRYLRNEYGGNFNTPEQKKMLAFLLGAACHGLEDDLFDSIFCLKSLEIDGSDQDVLDVGCDVFIIHDGYMDLMPDVYYPSDDLVNIFADELGMDINPADVESGLSLIQGAAMGGLAVMAPAMIEGYLADAPWAYENYYNPNQPASFTHESTVVVHYIQAIYDRIQGEFTAQDMLIDAIPTEGARLLSVDHTKVDSRITLVFGAGVLADYINTDYVSLTDPDGNVIPVEVMHSRYGGSDPSRLIQIRPTVDLEYETEYTVTLKSGIELIDGSVLNNDITYSFLSWCAPGNEEACLPEEDDIDMDDDPEATTAPTDSSGSNDDSGCSASPVNTTGIYGVAIPVMLLLIAGWLSSRRKINDRS